MKGAMRRLSTPEARFYAYRILASIGAIVTAYGLVEADKVELFVTLFAAVLGLQVAASNTPVENKTTEKEQKRTTEKEELGG